MHARTNIRSKCLEILKNNVSAGSHVYDSRTYRLESGVLPAIIIFTDHEEVVTDTIGYPRTQNRRLKLTIQCYCKVIDNVCREIDKLILEVEQRIASSSNLQGICKDCRLESTDITTHTESEQPVAIATMVFDVMYSTKENKPDLII